MNDAPIKLTYLTHEWQILEQMAQEKGAKDFRQYVKSSLTFLARNYPLPTIEEEGKKAINYIIPPNICARLTEFSKRRKIPLGALVRWYVSDPLLREHYESMLQLALK